MKNTFLVIFLLLAKIFSGQDFWNIIHTPDSIKIRAIAFDNKNDILIGTVANLSPGGIYRSSDLGTNWNLLYYNMNHSVLSLSVNKSGYIFAGTYGFYHLLRSTDNGLTWDSLCHYTSDIGDVYKIFTQGNDTVYINSSFSDVSNTSKILRSIDNGDSWDTLFVSGGFYISDFELGENNEMFVSLGRPQPTGGSVYHSVDFGETWEYLGLEGHQITTIEVNKNGDLFAAEWCGNVYVMYKGDEEFTTLENFICAEDIKINSDGIVYLGGDSPDGMLQSLDNGQSFQKINSGLNWGSLHVGEMEFDNNEYLFASEYLSNKMAKSVDSTTVSIDESFFSDIIISPNPFITSFSIKLPKQTKGKVKIQLLDMNGNLIKEQLFQNNYTNSILNFSINKEIPAGIYFFKVQSDNDIWTGKIMKSNF